MGKEKESDLELVKELIRHPGWLVLEKKAQVIIDNAQQRLNSTTKDGFDDAKGYLRGVKTFYDLIMINPLGIADFQGVTKLRRQ